MTPPPSPQAVRDFVEYEARLLDTCEWEAWDALFCEDGIYWMPATPNQPDGVNHVSLIHENAMLRQVRIERFSNTAAFSLQPRPRTARIVSGTTIESFDSETGDTIARSSFFAAQYTHDRQTIFAGQLIHHLVSDASEFKIRLKRVDLINCDGVHNDIHFYL